MNVKIQLSLVLPSGATITLSEPQQHAITRFINALLMGEEKEKTEASVPLRKKYRSRRQPRAWVPYSQEELDAIDVYNKTHPVGSAGRRRAAKELAKGFNRSLGGVLFQIDKRAKQVAT